ncbi:MAG: hypothetical protein CM1200mP41_19510 [Gammaproteobacteria bacterium]|nr:MAG: hypothetical protein CM1200mP41_19510 [Gammaproteobacteria bacterium]
MVFTVPTASTGFAGAGPERRGTVIDIALHDGIFRFLDEIAAVYDKTGQVRERMGTGKTHLGAPQPLPYIR